MALVLQRLRKSDKAGVGQIENNVESDNALRVQFLQFSYGAWFIFRLSTKSWTALDNSKKVSRPSLRSRVY